MNTVNKIYGYARCSTNETKQDITRQTRELKEMGVPKENIFFEYESGTNTSRVELNKLLGVVKEGDTIVTTEVSRITRSTKQLCEIVDLAQKRHLKLVIGAFVVDCTKGELDPMTEGMLKMMGVFAEMERNMISQRVKSGMEHARANGKKIGRPQKPVEEIPKKFMDAYKLYTAGNISKMDIHRMTGFSRPTIDRYIKKIKG